MLTLKDNMSVELVEGSHKKLFDILSRLHVTSAITIKNICIHCIIYIGVGLMIIKYRLRFRKVTEVCSSMCFLSNFIRHRRPTVPDSN